jgi:heat shock protein HslJ
MHTAAASLALLLALGLAAGCGGDDGDGDGAAGGSFVDVPWVVTSGVDLAGSDAPPSATFTDDTVGGSTGCNRFTAPYTIDGDALEIGMIATTRMACPPPADAVERAYLAALGRVAAWHLDGSQLVLADDDHNEVLRYDEASPLGDWEVTAFLSGDAVTSPLPGTTITARFADDGTLTGSSGCNTYQTAFTLGRGSIEIEPAASTEMACAEPEGVMDQEAAYLAAFPTVVGYRVDGGSLALLSADGTYVVSYSRATQP